MASRLGSFRKFGCSPSEACADAFLQLAANPASAYAEGVHTQAHLFSETLAVVNLDALFVPIVFDNQVAIFCLQRGHACFQAGEFPLLIVVSGGCGWRLYGRNFVFSKRFTINVLSYTIEVTQAFSDITILNFHQPGGHTVDRYVCEFVRRR